MSDDGCPITSGHRHDLESIFGKLSVAPTSHAQMMWSLFRKNPRLFEFGIEYIQDPETGECELIGISLITKNGEKE